MDTVPDRTSAALADGSLDLKRRLLSGGRGTVLMTVVTMAASFVSLIWLGREYGPDGLGEYAATTLYVIFVATLGTAGLPLAASQRVAKYEEAQSGGAVPIGAVLTIAILSAVAVAAFGWLTWQPYARLAGLRDVAPTALVMLALAGSVALFLTTGVLLARLRAVAATAVAVVQPLVVIGGIALGRVGLRSDASTLAAAGAAAAGLAAVAVLATMGVRPSRSLDAVGDITRRSIAASGVLYAYFLAGWIDRIFIVALVTTTALGNFSAANAIPESVLRLARNVGMFSVPAYARLAIDDTHTERVLDSQVRIMSTFFIATASTLVAAGPGLLVFLFGTGFVPAGTTLRLLAITLLPLGLLLSLAGIAVGRDDLRRAVRIMLLVAPLHMVGAITGIRYFSIAGVALSNLVVWTFAAILFAAPLRRDPVISMRVGMRIAGIAAPAFVFAWWLSLQPVPWPFSAAAAGSTGLALCAAFLLTRAEVRLLSGLGGRWLSSRGARA